MIAGLDGLRGHGADGVFPAAAADGQSFPAHQGGQHRARTYPAPRTRATGRRSESETRRSLRYKSGGFAKRYSETLNLGSWLNTDTAKQQLAMAGFRGQGAEYAFLTFRLVAPIVCFVFALVYVFYIADLQQSFMTKIAMAIFAAFVGIKAPELFLRNKTGKRQKTMNRAYPNMVDLLIICSESGMSIEHSARKVSMEIGAESIELTCRRALLADGGNVVSRTSAHRIQENLNMRTGVRRRSAN